jgi:hypothetical protein
MTVTLVMQSHAVEATQADDVVTWLRSGATMTDGVEIDSIMVMPSPDDDDDDLVVVIMEYHVPGSPEDHIGDLAVDNELHENLSELWPDFPYWSIWKKSVEPAANEEKS